MIIWLSSYPRSGNTFLRTLLKGCCDYDTYSIYNDYDIGGDPGLTAVTGHRMLEHKIGSRDFDLTPLRSSEDCYFIKTHEADRALVAEGDKIIYIIRDGREATLSFHKYLQKFHNSSVSPLELSLGLDFPGASWSEHVANWAPLTNADTLLLTFEDLTTDPRSAIDRVVAHAGITLQRYEIPEFQDLHRINPEFFRSGARRSYETEVSTEGQILFWLTSFVEMQTFGYTENLPPYVSEAPAEALVTAQNSLRSGVAYARAKIERVRQDMKTATAKLLDERAATLERKNSQIAAQQTSIKALESQILRTGDTERQHRESVAKLQRECERLEQSLRRTRRDLEAHRDSLSMLSNSWSWRLTKPFRAASRIASNLSRAGSGKDAGR